MRLAPGWPDHSRMVEWLDEAVTDFLAEDGKASRAYTAMRARGLTEEAAREEIARAMLGCLCRAIPRVAVADGGC